MEIPIWEKYILSIEEAAAYFNIGINKIRRLAKNFENADWILYNGNRTYIKRKEFEKFISGLNNI